MSNKRDVLFMLPNRADAERVITERLQEILKKRKALFDEQQALCLLEGHITRQSSMRLIKKLVRKKRNG